jgi:hypothetical protein
MSRKIKKLKIMKKICFTMLLTALFLFANQSFAQLSTRENEAEIVKLGARPVAGDMCFSLSYPILRDNTFGLKMNKNLLQYNDFITYRYYLTDKLVLKMGLMFWKSRARTAGTTIDTAKFAVSTNDYMVNDRQYSIIPGVEQHFSVGNIFDIWVGGNLNVGFGKNSNISNVELVNGDYNNYEEKRNTTLVGVGGAIGVNVFIAHLPLSIGLKYNFNSDWTFGGKWKVAESTKVGTTETDKEYFIQDEDARDIPDALQYDKLKRNLWDTNQEIRVVLNIYFSK